MDQKGMLDQARSEIKTMLDLIKDLKEYASDDEEASHIGLMQSSIEKLLEKVNEISQYVQKTDLEIEQAIND